MPGTFTMPNYEDSTEELITGIRELDKEISLARTAIEAELPLVRLRPFDHLCEVACVIPRSYAYSQDIGAMGRALYDGTPEEKQPWLDRVCDLRDNLDVSNLDLSDSQVRHNALTVCALKRAMPNLERENRAYFTERYADPVTRARNDGLIATQVAFASLLESMVTAEQDPSMMHFGSANHPFGVKGAQKNLENSVLNYRIQTLGESFKEIPFVVPAEFNQCMTMNIDKMKAPVAQDFFGIQKSEWAFHGLFCEPREVATVPENERLRRDDLVLIDGKSVRQIIDDKKLTLDPKQRELMGNNIIATALTSGKNRVDAVYLRMQDDGTMKTIVQPVKPDLTALGDTIKQDYSWFHRNLYNYGSHKCLTRAQKADALYQKPIPPKVEKQLNASLDSLTQKVGVYGVHSRNDIDRERMSAKRKVTSARELQDEISPSMGGTSAQRQISQQATKRQPNKKLEKTQ